mgnify:CR=1 FL=1
MTVSEEDVGQTSGSFWRNVESVFHGLMGCAIRNVDEICSKWRDMRAKCSEFNGIYNFVINNVHEADIDPVNVAMKQ